MYAKAKIFCGLKSSDLLLFITLSSEPLMTLTRLNTPIAVRVFTGSGLITGSDRIGPEIGYLAQF